MWHTNVSNHTYTTVKKNMDKDLQLAQDLPFQNRHIRCYIWQKASVTYGYNQELPDDLTSYPHRKRPTGGGIVFHAPNDMVLSFCFHQNDPWFPQRLRDLEWLTEYLNRCFLEASIIPHKTPQHKEKDIAFCSHYINPFELYYQNSKLVGISARKFRKSCLIQCIIHLGNSPHFFTKTPHYSDKMSTGIPFPIKVKHFHKLLTERVLHLKNLSTPVWV